MSRTYKYDRSSSKHRLRHISLVLGGSVLVVCIIIAAIIVGFHKSKPKSNVVSGGTILVPQATATESTNTFNETTYTIKLPSDWKVVPNPATTAAANSVSWQATIKGGDNRYLEIYVDTIPATIPVNRELPLMAHGNQLTYGELSDNCSNFTAGGTTNVAQAEQLKPATSIWQGVTFICDLPRVIDNQVGTGSSEGVNTVSVTGTQKGTHQYFFLYTDRNVEPDYTIFYDAISSFQAK
jgi:hypothetical protein